MTGRPTGSRVPTSEHRGAAREKKVDGEGGATAAGDGERKKKKKKKDGGGGGDDASTVRSG